MSSRFYLIPGFGESTNDKPYREIAKLAKNAGYKAMPIDIVWDRSTIIDWTEAARKKIEPTCGKGDIILGFSFGAYVAALLSGRCPETRLILASLSPYFKDNIQDLPETAKKYFGKRRMEAFSNVTFKPGTNETYFLMGDKDWEYGLKVLNKRYKSWKGKKTLSIIPEADHYIGHPNYLKVIRELIEKRRA